MLAERKLSRPSWQLPMPTSRYGMAMCQGVAVGDRATQVHETNVFSVNNFTAEVLL